MATVGDHHFLGSRLEQHRFGANQKKKKKRRGSSAENDRGAETP